MKQILFSIILVLISSWPVWGWAGEPGETKWCFNEVTNDVYLCTDWPAPAVRIWRGPKEVILRQWQEAQPCYQRMREAMKAMDSLIISRFDADRTDTLTLRERVGNAHMDGWSKVMKDCVEGGKP